jgi:hypothetical protein
MLCFGVLPCGAAAILLFEKCGSPSPAGSNRSPKGLMPRARPGGFATGRRIAWSRTDAIWGAAKPDGCDRDGRTRIGRRAAGCQRSLVPSLLAAGDGIRVFREGHDGGAGGGCLCLHIIHLIAIR